MKNPPTDVMLKALIMDSLITRGGKTLTGDIIQEITSELLERMMEVIQEEEKPCG